MEIQGTPSQIEQVLQAIERGHYIDIERMETASLPIDPEERDFHTR